jgi:ribonuclease BN (tRNA processing enzyme)
VFSGDTKASPNVVRIARDAKLLVHEVMYVQAMIDSGFPSTFANFLHAVHTDVTEVGKIADEAGVGRLALSHIIPINPTTAYGPTLSDSQWTRPIRADFAGPITVGADLMRLPVG